MRGHAGEVIERMVGTGSRELAVRDLGGNGPDVMLLHGLGCNLAFWDLVAPLLPDHFRVVSVDLPGHGHSTASAPSFEGDLEAVDTVRRDFPLHSPAVVGHSYGGMLAVGLAAARPGCYRQVINVDGLGFHHPDTPPELWSVMEPADQPEWPDVGDREWMEAQVLAEQQELAAIGVATEGLPAEIIRRGFAESADHRWHQSPSAAHFLALGGSLRQVNLLESYARSTCPSLTIISTRRHAATPEIAQAISRHVDAIRRDLEDIPAARVIDFAGGHYLHLESPVELANLLIATCG
jgi:pimeloyl-ACP methyl ester carboxylesterase